MYNIGDDNELDRLSREAAGRYEAPGNANWQAMQAELDKVLPEEKTKRRIIFFWWLLPVLMAGGAAVWLLQKPNAIQVIEKNTPVITKTDKIDQTPATGTKDNTVAVPRENAIGKTTTAKPEVDKQAITIVQPNKRLPVQKTGNGISLPGNSNSAVTIKAAQKNAVQQPLPLTNSSTTTPEAAIVTNKQEVIDKPATPNSKSNTDQAKEASNKIDTDKPVVTTIAVTKEDNHSPVPEVMIQPEIPNIQSNGFSNKSIYIAPGRWSFSLLAGVDKSTVKFKYSNGPGINIGLLAGYHFNDKWSLHTGAIYTQKNYKLAGEDFTAPKGSWVSYYTIDNVEGYCRMWEVPLLVRYTVSNTAKKSVFLSTGLSSYFMTKEDYTYYFNSNGVPTSRAATYPSTDTHIFSIAHLSIGFENRISNNLSLQIEPYAKIPFAGVGLGDIKISSFGVNFSLQLRQPLKK